MIQTVVSVKLMMGGFFKNTFTVCTLAHFPACHISWSPDLTSNQDRIPIHKNGVLLYEEEEIMGLLYCFLRKKWPCWRHNCNIWCMSKDRRNNRRIPMGKQTST